MEFNRLTPELGVANFATSLAFYTKILGFQIDFAARVFGYTSGESCETPNVSAWGRTPIPARRS